MRYNMHFDSFRSPCFFFHFLNSHYFVTYLILLVKGVTKLNLFHHDRVPTTRRIPSCSITHTANIVPFSPGRSYQTPISYQFTRTVRFCVPFPSVYRRSEYSPPSSGRESPILGAASPLLATYLRNVRPAHQCSGGVPVHCLHHYPALRLGSPATYRGGGVATHLHPVPAHNWGRDFYDSEAEARCEEGGIRGRRVL